MAFPSSLQRTRVGGCSSPKSTHHSRGPWSLEVTTNRMSCHSQTFLEISFCFFFFSCKRMSIAKVMVLFIPIRKVQQPLPPANFCSLEGLTGQQRRFCWEVMCSFLKALLLLEIPRLIDTSEMIPSEFSPGKLSTWKVFPDGPEDLPLITDFVIGDVHGCWSKRSSRGRSLSYTLLLHSSARPSAEHCTPLPPCRNPGAQALPLGSYASLASHEAPGGSVITHSIYCISKGLITSPRALNWVLVY